MGDQSTFRWYKNENWELKNKAMELGYLRVPIVALRGRDLSAVDKLVFSAILDYVREKWDGCCFPSQETLEILTEVPIRTLRRSLCNLVKANLIEHKKSRTSDLFFIKPEILTSTSFQADLECHEEVRPAKMADPNLGEIGQNGRSRSAKMADDSISYLSEILITSSTLSEEEVKIEKYAEGKTGDGESQNEVTTNGNVTPPLREAPLCGAKSSKYLDGTQEEDMVGYGDDFEELRQSLTKEHMVRGKKVKPTGKDKRKITTKKRVLEESDLENLPFQQVVCEFKSACQENGIASFDARVTLHTLKCGKDLVKKLGVEDAKAYVRDYVTRWDELRSQERKSGKTHVLYHEPTLNNLTAYWRYTEWLEAKIVTEEKAKDHSKEEKQTPQVSSNPEKAKSKKKLNLSRLMADDGAIKTEVTISAYTITSTATPTTTTKKEN